MEAFRILLLAVSIGATMAGTLYAGVQAERTRERESASDRIPGASPPRSPSSPSDQVQSASVGASREAPLIEVPTAPEAEEPTAPQGDAQDAADALLEPTDAPSIDALEAAIAEMESEDILLENGFRIGTMTLLPAPDPENQPETEDDEAASAASDEAEGREENEVLAAGPGGTTPTEGTPLTDEPEEAAAENTSGRRVASRRRGRTRRAPRTPPRPPMPRLHPNPGQHTLLVARQMMARNEVVLGSCYRYLSEVFKRAGHHGWRNRRIVYRAEREGPYADLNLIRPGDWLYIVNDPGRTPVGTHSVMFVGWRDRARGYARVISHPGWGAPSAGREGEYDVSMTYRIIRPTLPQ